MALRQAAALPAALKGLKRAFKAAGPNLRSAPGYHLTDAVRALATAVEDTHGTEFLGLWKVGRIRGAFKQAGNRLARAMAAAIREGDLALAERALELAAALGEAATDLQFREVERRNWSFGKGWAQRPQAIVWRANLLDARALTALAAATLQMDAARLAARFRSDPSATDLATLLDAPSFLETRGFALLDRALGHTLPNGQATELLRGGALARITALLSTLSKRASAVSYSSAAPPQGLAEIVSRAQKLGGNGSRSQPANQQLHQLLQTLPRAWLVASAP